MNIYSHETERCRELQRQLHDAEQFRALVLEMRISQRKRRNGECKETTECRNRLQDAVDRELRLLDSE